MSGARRGSEVALAKVGSGRMALATMKVEDREFEDGPVIGEGDWDKTKRRLRQLGLDDELIDSLK